eukprot:CAMPEP_0116874470 /NCGR_PEP_ID=MMETSP0463-20121206/5925_1 /TAXON_ID=181622 /ORGANISM="Strombidinopsis sp, Strain SopsisLIS2011" /LENGTH=44 /DNA_ID= /DNA_START= /DNA_END= /DNA_ORIENTATION=
MEYNYEVENDTYGNDAYAYGEDNYSYNSTDSIGYYDYYYGMYYD